MPFSSPGNLPDPGIEALSPALQADSWLLSHQGSPNASLIGSKVLGYTVPPTFHTPFRVCLFFFSIIHDFPAVNVVVENSEINLIFSCVCVYVCVCVCDLGDLLFSLYTCIIISFILEFQDVSHCWWFHFNCFSPRHCTFNMQFNKFTSGKIFPILFFSIFFSDSVFDLCWVFVSYIHI